MTEVITVPENLTPQTILLYILYIVMILVLPVITKYGISVAKVFLSSTLEKMENKYAADKINRAIEIVLQAVSETTQTFVSTLKEKGEFTKENAEEAFERAKKLAKSLMTDEVIKYVGETYNDFDLWLNSKIEQAVLDGKTPVIVIPAEPIAEE